MNILSNSLSLFNTFNPRRSNHGEAATFLLLAIALTSMIGLGTFASDSAETMTHASQNQTGIALARKEVEASDILADPTKFYDSTVLIKDEIKTIFTPQVFLIENDKEIEGDELFVILSRKARPSPNPDIQFDFLNHQSKVRILGRVHTFNLEDLPEEVDINWQEIDPKLLNKPIIVAEQVLQLPG